MEAASEGVKAVEQSDRHLVLRMAWIFGWLYVH